MHIRNVTPCHETEQKNSIQITSQSVANKMTSVVLALPQRNSVHISIQHEAVN